jgi:hypothetical protein
VWVYYSFNSDLISERKEVNVIKKPNKKAVFAKVCYNDSFRLNTDTETKVSKASSCGLVAKAEDS